MQEMNEISETRQDAARWRLEMLNRGWIENRTQWSVRLTVLATLCWMAPTAWAQYVPPIVVTSTATVAATGLPGNLTNVALDACGDIYTVNQGSGQVVEIPYGGGTAATVLGAAITYDTAALGMDPGQANLYVLEGDHGSAIKIPISNCVPQTAAQSTIGIGNLGAVSYYWAGSAVASDSAGDVFIATSGACCAANYELLEEYPASGYKNGATLLPSLANPITSIAIDSTGNIYYVSGGALYELAVTATATSSAPATYSSTPVSFGSGYISVVGVALDALGNLYVADQGTSAGYPVNGYYPNLYFASILYEIPYATSGSTPGLNPADQYILVQGTGSSNPLTLTNGLTVAPSRNIFFTGNTAYNNNAGNSVYELTLGSGSFGAASVGSNASATLNVQFNAAETPASIGFAGNSGFSSTGGTCAAGTAYAVGSFCTVAAQFTPTAPGLAVGALVLSNSSGGQIGIADLSGVGTGAGLTMDPGTVAAIGSGYTSPTAAALDASGDLFVADSTANKVWEIAAGSSTPASVGTGLKAPQGVAVDGAGDLYIADTGNNRIVEIPVVSGALSSANQTAIVGSATSIAGAALSGPTGLTVDAQGNLYIADTGNSRIVFLPGGSSSNLPGAFTVGSGWKNPLATAVSSTGTIYVADSGHGDVSSLAYPTGPQALVATGFGDPSALATDAAGDLFVADKGNTQVMRIPNVSGSLATSGEFTVGTGIADPYGLAIDPNGNLYVTDSVNAAVYSVARTNALQSFGKWGPTTTSTPLSYFIESAGNSSLTLKSPYYTASGNTADFAASTSSNGCTAGEVLAIGADCVVGATFTPPTNGTFTETLTFSSNATNGSVQKAAFTGIGQPVVATTTTLSVTSPSGSPYYGEAISLSVSVTSSNGTPVGTVALQVDGIQMATATLTNGIATFSIPSGLGGGSHTLQAFYRGASTATTTYAQSFSALQTINVSKVSTATTLAFTTLYAAPSSQPACASGAGCQGLTLTATLTPSEAGLPTGNIAFTITPSNGAPIVQSVPLTPSGGAFQASYTYYPAAPASGSSYYTASVQAAYAGDTNFAGSASAVSPPFYVSPSGGSLVLTASGTSLTASAATGSTITFTPTTYGGWTGLVGFGCTASSLPANARCVFSPGQVQVTPNTSSASPYIPTVTVTVTIDQPPQTPTASMVAWWLAGPVGLLLFFSRRRFTPGARAPIAMALGVILLAIAAMGLGGCSSSLSNVTPAGTSTITVNAYSDPFTVASVAGGNPATATCPTSYPTSYGVCAQQAFQVALTVQ